MTKKEIFTDIAAVVTTLADLDTDAPESMLYLAMGSNMERYETIKHLLVVSDLVTVKGHRVALTAKGRETAAKLNEALAFAKK